MDEPCSIPQPPIFAYTFSTGYKWDKVMMMITVAYFTTFPLSASLVMLLCYCCSGTLIA